MYTMEIRPINRAAKKLANPRMFRASLIRQIPHLADATFGIMVRDAVNRGYLDLATSMAYDPKRGRIYIIPGMYVRQGQARGMEATTQKVLAKDLLGRIDKEAQGGAEKAQKAKKLPPEGEMTVLIKTSVIKAFDAARVDMVEELA